MLATLLFPLLLAAGEPAPDANQLLTEAAEKLRGLKGFSVHFRERVFAPGRSMKTFHTDMDVAPGGRVRLYMGKERQLLVSNGEKWWRYSELRNVYSETTDPESGLAQGAAQAVSRVVDRIGALQKGAGQVRFLRWETIRVEDGRFRCAVVELRSKDNGGLWTARLWIEPATSLPRRFDHDKVAGVTDFGDETKATRDLNNAGHFTRTTTELLIHWKSLEAPGDEELFEFTPPPGATRPDAEKPADPRQ